MSTKENDLEWLNKKELVLILLVSSLIITWALIPFVDSADWAGNFSTGLSHVYTMSEGSGTFINNTANALNNGTFTVTTGSIDWVNGKLGGGLLINADGDSAWINLGTLNLTNIYTINFWVNLTNPAASDQAFFHTTTNYNPIGSISSPSTDSYPSAQFDGSTSSVSNKSLTSNTWAMVTYQANAVTDKEMIWVNGEIAGSFSVAISPVNEGFSITRTGGYGLDGEIDEFYIWNRTLTEADIILLYNQGKGCQYNNESCFVTNPTINQYSKSFNLSALEYSQQNFSITIIKSNNTTSLTPQFIYNGTNYTDDIVTLNDSNIFTYSVLLNTSVVAATNNENKSFYWNFTLVDGDFLNYTNFSYEQNVSRMIISNSTAYTQNTINYTCLDDETSSQVNCTITSYYYLFNPQFYDIGTFRYYSFYEQNVTPLKHHYKFPSGVSNYTANISLTVLGNGYPQRVISFTGHPLTETAINKNIYLTSTSNGQYVTFQVLNPASIAIEDVFVNVSRSGVIITNGYTDAAGLTNFWLNPDLQYNLTFTKSGYTDYSVLLYPTQTAYTITMGTLTSNASNYLQGISWNIYPTQNTLTNDTEYLFIFTIDSQVWDLESYGFVLTDENGTVYGGDSGTTATGENLTATLNTSSNNETIIMEYWWTVNNSQTNLTRIWNVYYTYKGDFSIMYFFDDLRNFGNSGFNDFSRTLLAFAVIIMLVGMASLFGLNSPMAIMGLLVILVWIFTIGGLIKLSPNAPTNYAAAILMSALFIGYWWYKTH